MPILEAPTLIAGIPFALTLFAIAILPVAARRWWRSMPNKGAVIGLLALPAGIFLVRTDPSRLLASFHDYVAFVCMIGSLYVISGGILLSGDLRATPLVNAGFLFVGAVLASVVGTPAASLLLIRPLLRTNDQRLHTLHIPLFFIFLAGNIGGCLSPLGNPPLFLGFIRGVPFFWTLSLWPQWLLAVVSLLAIFLVIDTFQFRREPQAAVLLDRARIEPVRLQGGANLLPLAGILLLVIFAPTPWRETGMVLLAIASYVATPRGIHRANEFTLHPLGEVAVLFFGIFVTIAPVLAILECRGSALQITKPWEYFWTTGVLSSFLDNAPSYLALSTIAMSTLHIEGDGAHYFGALLTHPGGEALLRAISVGAVFMGANTYIGNGPNFMVKAICEARGSRMPSFLGYMGWSAAILLPVYVVLTLVFFR